VIASLPLFAHGLLLTVALCLASLSGSLVLGTVAGVLRVRPMPALRWAGIGYVELVRNLPPLLILVFVFFALPRWGIVLDPFPSAAIALSVYGGAFVAEAVRGGILSVRPAKVEAARALGLSGAQTHWYIVLPQDVRRTRSPLVGELVLCIKNTSLGAPVGLDEPLRRGEIVYQKYVKPIETLTIVGLIYWALCFALGQLGRRLEREAVDRAPAPRQLPAGPPPTAPTRRRAQPPWSSTAIEIPAAGATSGAMADARSVGPAARRGPGWPW
jgi:His/Glu/Gln/Arg/opine family amino acid ABC transporter permease subunit